MHRRVRVHAVVVTGSEETGSGEIAAALSGVDGLTIHTQSAPPETADGYDAVVVVDAPPASDGVAVYEGLRGPEELLPVVLVGLDADAERVEMALDAGVTEYVVWDRESAETVTARLRTHVKNPVLDGGAHADRWESMFRSFAHDVKNPLNVISGRMELLDVDETHGDAIMRSLGRVESLTNELAAVAAFCGPLPETESVPLDEVAPPVWAGLTTASATLEVRTDRTIEANRDYLEALLARLFDNAIVHGGEDVTVVVGATEDGFYVADDGPGIDADQREDVFEQGYGTTREGEGYGLFVAACIADAHGWSLTATESEAGGARFNVRPR